MYPSGARPSPTVDHTDDFAARHRRMREKGVRFLEEPRHEPYGTVAVFEDLNANRQDLLEPRR